MIILFIIIFLAGLFPLWKLLQFILLEEKIRKRGARAAAEIVSIKSKAVGASSRRVLLDDVQLKYKDESTGQWRLAVLSVKKGKIKYGAAVNVLYLADRPGKVVIENSKREYWPALLLAAFICFIMIVAIVNIRVRLSV